MNKSDLHIGAVMVDQGYMDTRLRSLEIRLEKLIDLINGLDGTNGGSDGSSRVHIATTTVGSERPHMGVVLGGSGANEQH